MSKEIGNICIGHIRTEIPEMFFESPDFLNLVDEDFIKSALTVKESNEGRPYPHPHLCVLP